MPYLDTSVLGSFYCPETLSAAVNVALRSASIPSISWLSKVEFVSLLSFKVRARHIVAADADRIRRQFQDHRSQRLFRILPLADHHFAQAALWLSRFNTSLRTLDALHLAIASANRQPLWTTDKLLAASARVLGVSCKLIT